MARVSDEVRHMLAHINAVANKPKYAGNAEVQARATRMREFLAAHEGDPVERTREDLVDRMKDQNTDTSLDSFLSTIERSNNGQRIRRYMSDWVRDGDRFLDGD